MSRLSDKQQIGFLVITYPKLSETFVLQEILSLERSGQPLHIFSLQRPTDSQFHAITNQVKAKVSYLDGGTNMFRDALAMLKQIVGYPLKTATTLKFLFGREEANKITDFRQALRLAKCTRQYRIAHIHAHFASRPAAIAELAQRLCGAGFSISAHAKDIYLSPESVLKRKLAAAQFTVTCTEYNHRYLERINSSSSPIVRVYHGLDKNRFNGDRRIEDDNPVEPFILGVGRLREKKGFDCLIGACRLLKHAGRKFRCGIVGYGPEREKLQRLIDLFELNDRVQLLGTLTHEELVSLYQRTEIFALPCQIGKDGDRDGIPNVLMEAMAMGIAVVTSRVSGIPELVEHRVSGLLTEPRDSRALVEALGLLIENPEYRRMLGEAGKQRVAEQFDLESNIATLRRLLRQSLESISPGKPISLFEDCVGGR